MRSLLGVGSIGEAVHDSTQSKHKAARKRARMSSPGEEDDEPQAGSESRVGKKLSALTIRRVIVLVLSMLICLPMFSPEEGLKHATSAQYGADEIWMRFEGSSVGPESYETAMLRFVYFHNWFSGNGDCPAGTACPNTYSSHLYWVGIAGVDGEEVIRQQAQRAQLRQSVVEDPRVLPRAGSLSVRWFCGPSGHLAAPTHAFLSISQDQIQCFCSGERTNMEHTLGAQSRGTH